jgi:hypothetical protein
MRQPATVPFKRALKDVDTEQQMFPFEDSDDSDAKARVPSNIDLAGLVVMRKVRKERRKLRSNTSTISSYSNQKDAIFREAL